MSNTTFKFTVETIAAHYEELNANFFGSSLPVVPFRVACTKTRGGCVKFTAPRGRPNAKAFLGYRVKPELLKIRSLEMSNFYSRTEEEFRLVLIHEMIHVELVCQGIVYTTGDSVHGSEFMNRLRELEKLSGWKIPVSESRDASEVSDHVARKAVECLVMSKAGKNLVSTFTLGCLSDGDREALVKRLGRRGYKGIRFAVSDHIELQKCTHHRKVAHTLHLSLISVEVLAELRGRVDPLPVVETTIPNVSTGQLAWAF